MEHRAWSSRGLSANAVRHVLVFEQQPHLVPSPLQSAGIAVLPNLTLFLL